MPRALRIEYAGATYHVMNRGDRREAIFNDDADRKRFVETLGEACAKTDWQVHAYCLMGNHFHLVVETPNANLVAGYTSAAVTNVTVNAVPATISTNETNFTATVPLPNGTNIVSIVAQPSASNTPISTKLVQFPTSASGSAPAPLTYDLNGNCTQDENGNEYTWDALNRLVAIVYTTGSNAGNHTEMAYDGLSRRVQIVERDGTTIGSGTITSTKNYVWVGSEIAEERNASDTVTKRFFPQGEQQIVSGTATPYYYTFDHDGSVREFVDGSGTIQARYFYDPYGNTTLVQGTNLATFQYAQMYMHQISGLHLTSLGNTYDASTGRWIGRDRLGERASMNLYEYVYDDPVDLSDPLGLYTPGRGKASHPVPPPPTPQPPDFPVPTSTGKIIPGTGDPGYNCMAYGVGSGTWQQPDPGKSPNTVPPKFGCKQVEAGDSCPCHQHKVLIFQDSGDQDNWHVYRSCSSGYGCKYGQCSAYNNISNPTQDYSNVYNPKGKVQITYWCCPGD